MTTATSIPAEAVLLTELQAALMTQIPDRTIRQMVSAGLFPKPIKLGPTAHSAKRYVRSEIEQWMRQRIEER